MKLEKTQLKLVVSKKSGKLVGFVYRHVKTKKLLGVREDDRCGKQICLLSDEIPEESVRPNKLYQAYLTAMHNGNGYVITSLQPIEFPAQVQLKITPRRQYHITISFGNKVIYYDPVNGRSPSSRTLEGVVKLIKEREDIEDTQQVINDLLEQADMLDALMERDNFQPPKSNRVWQG